VRLLRGPVAQTLRFDRAGVYVTGPTGGPRLVASSTELDAPVEATGPSPLREAAARAAAERGGAPFTIHFSGARPACVLVIPIRRAGQWLGSLVVFRFGPAFTDEDHLQGVANARLVARVLAG
jgi:hypothetical protein